MDVGGMYVTKSRANVHPRWLNRVVRTGDEILVRVVESPSSDRPKWKTVNTQANIRQQQRAYYFQMKRKFEPERESLAGRRTGKAKGAK